MSVRGVTVDCADHGEMTRDGPGRDWACPAGACGTRISDAEVYRLASARGDGPDMVPIVVSPVSGGAVAVPDWLDAS